MTKTKKKGLSSSSLGLTVLLVFLPETCTASFAQAREASMFPYHRRNMIKDTANNRRDQGQTNFFDAVALSYSDTNELEKLITKNSSLGKKRPSRQLEGDGGLLATRKFPKCIEQSLSPEECQSWIEKQIESAGGHEVGDVKVKIQTPRTPEQFAESYWMVEVPVNLYSKVACDRNDGKTFYPFKWTDGTTGTMLDVEDQDCFGLTAGECCLKVRSYGKQLTTSGYDKQKQCLSCFVHQEPLEPVVNEETGETDYLECKDIEGGKCVQEQLTGAEVDALDLQTVERIEIAITSLESIQTDRSCDTFDQLLEELYNAAVVIKPLSIKIGRLACMVCHGIHDLSFEDDVITYQLAEILMLLKKHIPPAKKIDSKENCIIIFTNPDGEVARYPALGGSWSDNMTGKEMVPHVPPAPTPTVAPTVAPVRSKCRDNTDCNDKEWCNTYSYCAENVCITNPPGDCKAENQVCRPAIPGAYYEDAYRCIDIDCKADPSICKENEYCGRKWVYKYEIYTCEEFKDLGEACGYSYFDFDRYYRGVPFDGECYPGVSFCLDPLECTYNYIDIVSFDRQCVAYGEGSCLDENTGEVTQANCNSDEYCDDVQGRCKPYLNEGECCSPELNNCGYGTELGSLICAPYIYYHDLFVLRVVTRYICQKACDTDEDCGSNEWCAPVDGQEDVPPNYPGRFCKKYKRLGEECQVSVPGLVGDIERDNEDRCDPSILYCYDPYVCRGNTDEIYFSYGTCMEHGNQCTSDSDCADATMEWCHVDVGYCRYRSFEEECCLTAGDESMDDCLPGLSCEPVTLDSYNPGAGLCTKV